LKNTLLNGYLQQFLRNHIKSDAQTTAQAAQGISVDFELVVVLAIIPIFIFQLKTKAFCQHIPKSAAAAET
jgi:hypothetical protein